MDLLVIGSGLMGSAAAYDMARSAGVASVTLADADLKLARDAAQRIAKLIGRKNVRAVRLDASNTRAARKLMEQHTGALSAVPYFLNLGLAKAAIDAGCHFADLGGNNTVVRKTLALEKQARKKDVALAPDCGLSPGMASILAGDLLRRIGGRADALKLYVGGLPADPQPVFHYELVFSVEGLINEYVEPARILRDGKIKVIEPLSEPETFRIVGFPPLVAFHTSGGASTMPENFAGKVKEAWEKTLRYHSHFPMIRALYDFGLFSSEKRKVGKVKIAPRELMAQLFQEKLKGAGQDVVIMRIEAHRSGGVLCYTCVDRFDARTGMTAMMRTTAWPASVVLQMICSRQIAKRGAIYQELDVPAGPFLREMEQRGIDIVLSEGAAPQH